MIIPRYLNKDDIVGVTACSCGVIEKIDKYEKSISNFSNYGFRVIETDNVRTGGIVSSSKEVRARELDSLYIDSKVKMIAIASGGDFLYEMLDCVNYDNIRNNVKWIAGSSDPTSLLFVITTNYDIATIYSPCNMSGFDTLYPYLNNYIEIIRGERKIQTIYSHKESVPFSDEFDLTNEWVNIKGNVSETGILIGGCIDSLRNVIGTKYDKTKEFVAKYSNEGIIWYFDIFSMKSEDLYNTLLQFRDAGWFKYTKAILLGRVCFPSTFVDMTYEDAIDKAIDGIKVIYNFDVGHVKPSFTMINGIKARIVSNDKEHFLEFLEEDY